MIKEHDYMPPRDSDPYKKDQKSPMFRKELKRLIERGIPRKLARPIAHRLTAKVPRPDSA
jgi:hypothetical protein